MTKVKLRRLRVAFGARLLRSGAVRLASHPLFSERGAWEFEGHGPLALVTVVTGPCRDENSPVEYLI